MLYVGHFRRRDECEKFKFAALMCDEPFNAIISLFAAADVSSHAKEMMKICPRFSHSIECPSEVNRISIRLALQFN